MRGVVVAVHVVVLEAARMMRGWRVDEATWPVAAVWVWSGREAQGWGGTVASQRWSLWTMTEDDTAAVATEDHAIMPST